MQKAAGRGIGKVVIRVATKDVKVESSYCTKCGFNHYSNIGFTTCAKCSKYK